MRKLYQTVRGHNTKLYGSTALKKAPEKQVESRSFLIIWDVSHIYCIHTYIHIHIHTYMYAYIHTYIYTYIHTYVHTYVHTYLLTLWCRVVLEKLNGLQVVKKFPAFYGTRRFNTILTSVRHLSLSWASPIQSTYPHPTTCRSILTLYTHQRLGLLSGLFPSGFPPRPIRTPLLTHTRQMPFPSHSSRFYHPHNIGCGV